MNAIAINRAMSSHPSIDDYGRVVRDLRFPLFGPSTVEFHTDVPCVFFPTTGDRKMANSNQGNQNQSGNRGGNQGDNKGGSGSGRGFASMDTERQREISAEGGRAAHASGNAHEFTSEEAREAGSKSHGGSNNSGGGAGNTRASGDSGNTRGGSSDQHARAGSQSHKNDR
jgi:hypothetical protein